MDRGGSVEDCGKDTEIKQTGDGTGLAKLCSMLFHPFLMPIYGVVILLYGPTYISILPERLKLYLIGVFTLTTFLFPVFSIGLLKSLRIIPDLSLASQRERVIPLIIVAIGYTTCYFLISNYLMIGIFPQLLMGALVIILVCFAINLFWKISLHMAAMGGIVGMFLYVSLNGYGVIDAPLLASLLCAGLLGTARLYLGKHNVLQILAGFMVGVGVMGCAVNLF